jgi:phage gp45-like
MSKITVYEGNSATIECAVLNPDGTDASLVGYTATLTVKTNKTDIAALFTSTGTISGNDITFSVTAANNSRAYGVYYYEVTVVSGTTVLTVAQDRYIVKQSIVYVT